MTDKEAATSGLLWLALTTMFLAVALGPCQAEAE